MNFKHHIASLLVGSGAGGSGERDSLIRRVGDFGEGGSRLSHFQDYGLFLACSLVFMALGRQTSAPDAPSRSPTRAGPGQDGKEGPLTVLTSLNRVIGKARHAVDCLESGVVRGAATPEISKVSEPSATLEEIAKPSYQADPFALRPSPLRRSRDLAASKNVPLGGRPRMRFRFETFNTFNRVEFGLPNANINMPLAGNISSQVNSPRDIQLGLKLLF